MENKNSQETAIKLNRGGGDTGGLTTNGGGNTGTDTGGGNTGGNGGEG